jgi:RNA polymerase sigma factor (sigma-70 family)
MTEGRIKGAATAYDELLVVLTMAGDRDAANRLARRWHPRLLRTARRLVGPGMAPGAVQDCWVSILRGIDRLMDPGRFAPWAFGILRRRCADAIRRQSTARSRDGGDLSGTEPDATALPGEALTIARAMADLPPDQRLAAQLFFVEGLTLAEIAEVQQVPEGTAKSRLFHARRRLKAALSGDD